MDLYGLSFASGFGVSADISRTIGAAAIAAPIFGRGVVASVLLAAMQMSRGCCCIEGLLLRKRRMFNKRNSFADKFFY